MAQDSVGWSTSSPSSTAAVIAVNALHPQYVVDENQTPKAVLLPVAEWDQVMEELEELDDIRACDLAKAGSQDAIPFEQAVREIQEGSGE